MSSMRYSKSFRNVPRPDFRVAPLDSHQFLYDVHDLHTLHGRFDYLTEMGGVQGLAVSLRTDIKDGLYKDEVEVANDTFKRRTEIYGANIYVRPPLKTFLEFCLEAVSDPMLIILSIAGVISVGLGIWESPSDGWYEGISIVIAVVLVTSISAGNNYKQQLEFAKLDRDNSFDDVTVIRGGQVKRIPQMDILVGDVIQLAAGGFIPADGVLIADEEIKVNESRMTGESRDVEKNFYSPFLFAGTEVRQGQAMMLATAVGSESAFGRILAALASEQSETPLQEKLNEAAEFIGKFGAGVGLVLFITLFIRWMVQDVSKGTEDVTIMTSNVTSITESQSIGWHAPTKNDWNTFIYYFIMAITIIVVAVPEGLPLAVTVSLAYSMSRMRADQIMVHVLSAAETMGNVTTICSDKTGTLTQNLMTVVRTYLGGKFSEQRPTKEQIIESPIVRQLLIESIAINSKAWCEEKDIEKGKPAESWPWKEGNQTEISLLAWISSYDINVSAERNAIPVEKSHPFDSIKKYSTVVLRSSLNEEQVLEYEGDLRQYFKGAAERIVQSCTRQVDWKGRVTPLDAPAKEQVLAAIDSMTRSGLRTIAFSYVDHQENDVPTNDDGVLSEPPARNDCVLIGVAGIQDPLRPETYGAVRKCQKAGIVVRMVTGDHLETAKSIAKECGILTSDKHVAMLGEQFRKLVEAGREEELLDLLPRLRVLARSSPEDKEALVKWYGAHGHVVAVTGDGTNDAPALKAADVGLAMYLNGTAVARAAAQVWIMDDNFSSIVKSVVWGRAVFDNIRKFVQFQLTINVVALMLSLIGAFSGYENPLGAVQLLWVNLIMDTFAALALGTELPNEALLDRKPYTRDSFLISPAMFRNILTMSVYQLFVLLLLLYGADKFFTIGDGLGSTEHYTILFNCFVLMQFANEINCRKCNREMNVFENLLANHAFNIIMVFSIGVQAILVEFGGGFAKTTGLTGSQWAGCLVIGVSPLVAGAIFRLIPADAYKGQIDVEESVFDGAHLTDMRYDERRMTKAASFLQQQPLKAENDREEDRQEQHPRADNDKETEHREAEQRKQNKKEIEAVERIQTGLGLETEKEEKESTEKLQDS